MGKKYVSKQDFLIYWNAEIRKHPLYKKGQEMHVSLTAKGFHWNGPDWKRNIMADAKNNIKKKYELE